MKTTVLLPGGFKPPHAGHLQLANAYANHPAVEKVIVLVGPSERDGITMQDSLKVWALLPTHPKVQVVRSPVDNPMEAAFETVLNLNKNATGRYAMGASSKGSDAERSKAFVSYLNKHKNVPTVRDKKMTPRGIIPVMLSMDTQPLLYKGRRDQLDGTGVSASVLRKDIKAGNINKFATNYPGIPRNIITQIYDILTKKKSRVRVGRKRLREFADILENRAVFRTAIRQILNEGGAAGHMAHPFDIPAVKSGKDLIKVFQETENYLQRKEVPVKIDGINSSIRLIDSGKGKEFALDRGSNKPLDVKGVTAKDLNKRFDKGHGMIQIGGTVLSIFNEALSSIKGPLKKLGLIDDPNILLNIEYVEGKSNVQQYKGNFIVIHNLLRIDQVTPNRRASEPVSYNLKDLQDLVDGLKPTAKKRGFDVFNVIPAKLSKKSDMTSELSKTYTVNIDKKQKESKSLAQWLSSAKNTKGIKLKLKDGRTVDALSKQVYMWINEGKSVSDLVQDPKDYKVAVDSYLMYLATIKLGDALLKSMDSPLGPLNTQEGVVIPDNKSVSSVPYKITGSFITRGLESSFNK